MKRARIKISVNGQGFGETFINGIRVTHLISGLSVASVPGEAPIVRFEIPADQVLFEGDDVYALIALLQPEVQQHTFVDRVTGFASEEQNAVCVQCRQVKRVAASHCPGKLARHAET